MTTQRRMNRKANLHLESLEQREAPTVGISGAWQAALAQAQNMGPRALPFPGVQRELPMARPGVSYQFRGPVAISFGGWNGNGFSPRSMMNGPLVLAQARRAAIMPSVPAVPNGTLNHGVPNTPWAIRSALRAPVTIPGSSLPTPMTPSDPTPSPTPSAGDGGTTSDGSGGATQSLPPNVSGVLNGLYQSFSNNSTLPTYSGPGSLQIVGSNVGVYIHGNGQGDFSGFVSTLQNLGMEISSTNAVTWTVSGMLPISQLPTAAQTPQTVSITPRTNPWML